MEKKLETLYKLCEALMEELEDYSKRIEKTDGMSVGDLEAVDKLAHALKSVKTTIAMMESGEEGNSFRSGNSNRYMPWYGGISYEGGQGGRSNARDGRGGMSSARRGGTNNPSGRNQYSREGGYSYADEEFQKALEEALDAAPDERVREKLQRIMDNM